MRPGIGSRPECHDTRHGVKMRNVLLWRVFIIFSVMTTVIMAPARRDMEMPQHREEPRVHCFCAGRFDLHVASLCPVAPVAIRFGPPSGAGKAMGCRAAHAPRGEWPLSWGHTRCKRAHAANTRARSRSRENRGVQHHEPAAEVSRLLAGHAAGVAVIDVPSFPLSCLSDATECKFAPQCLACRSHHTPSA
jgi:hypothetical protein